MPWTVPWIQVMGWSSQATGFGSGNLDFSRKLPDSYGRSCQRIAMNFVPLGAMKKGPPGCSGYIGDNTTQLMSLVENSRNCLGFVGIVIQLKDYLLKGWPSSIIKEFWTWGHLKCFLIIFWGGKSFMWTTGPWILWVISIQMSRDNSLTLVICRIGDEILLRDEPICHDKDPKPGSWTNQYINDRALHEEVLSLWMTPRWRGMGSFQMYLYDPMDRDMKVYHSKHGQSYGTSW